jgi:hypothetical protein
MSAAIWAVSLLLAELVMAPINLWTGRTMPAFIAFTGFRSATARRIFAPVKLASAVLVAAGLALPRRHHRRRRGQHGVRHRLLILEITASR